MKQIIYILLLSFFVVTTGLAQSRLKIGTEPKLPSVGSEFTLMSLNRVSGEVTIDTKTAVMNFYKNLLLTPSKSENEGSTQRFIAPQQVREFPNDLFASKDIRVKNIYPNPVNDRAFIDYRIEDSNVTAEISVHNLLGSRIQTYPLDAFGSKLEISAARWDDGIYFYQLVVDGKKVATKKLLVRHN